MARSFQAYRSKDNDYPKADGQWNMNLHEYRGKTTLARYGFYRRRWVMPVLPA